MIFAQSPEEKPKKVKKLTAKSAPQLTLEKQPAKPEFKTPDPKAFVRSDWEIKMLTSFVENSDTIPKEVIEENNDSAALIVGREVLRRMRITENWVKRATEDKWDFAMRWNLKEEATTS
jgi:hypothetical protein